MSPRLPLLLLLPLALAGCTVQLARSCAYPVGRAGWTPEPQPPAALLAEYADRVGAGDAWFRRPDGSLLACRHYDAARDDCGVESVRFPMRNGRHGAAEVDVCARDRSVPRIERR